MKKKLIIFGLLTLVFCSLSLLFLDAPTQHLQTAEQADRSYRLVRTLTDAGEGGPFFLVALLGMGISWFYLHRKKDVSESLKLRMQKVWDWCLSFFYSLVSAGILAQFLKMSFGRQRPHVTPEYDPWVFDPFNLHWHNHSFPSGHSQTLFVVVTALCSILPKWKGVIFILGLALALTRIPLHQHFLSDVVLGAYVGYAVTLLIFNRRQG